MSDNLKSKQKNSSFKDLLLLFLVPIAIATIAALAVYTPKFLANPTYDFIYMVCENYHCKDNYYTDSSGHIIKDSHDEPDQEYSRYYPTAQLRYYDTLNDSSRSLSLEEARQFTLDTSSKSQDGYTLTRENSSSGFLFWGDYDEGWYLKNGGRKKEVNLATTNSYNSRDITFLGWVNK